MPRPRFPNSTSPKETRRRGTQLRRSRQASGGDKVLAPVRLNLRRCQAMTVSTYHRSLIVILLFSAAALGFSHAALAQAAGQPTMAAQVETPPADAVKTASGLAYVIQAPGRDTVHPTDSDLVKVVALAFTKESAEGKPTSLGSPSTPMQMAAIAVPGLREALALMTKGQRMRLWMPEKLAFAGASGKPKGPLMVDVMLLDIIPVPPTPTDLTAPPPDAQKTKSGLVSKVMKPGTGTARPKSSSTVTVHYTGWLPDGTIFDSSVIKGQPATFPLGDVIKGWTEGVQLMVAGEKRRFWIPGKLAYDGSENPNAPKGMLVFDIELITVDGK
jgi:FKBP-type peptidyl-prolyl cis-trans isomerase